MFTWFVTPIPKVYHGHLFLFGFAASLVVLPIVFGILKYFEAEAQQLLHSNQEPAMGPRPWWFNVVTVLLVSGLATMATPHFVRPYQILLIWLWCWTLGLQIMIEIRCRFLADELHYFLIALGLIVGLIAHVAWYWLLSGFWLFGVCWLLVKGLERFNYHQLAAMFSPLLFASAGIWLGPLGVLYMLMNAVSFFLTFNVLRFMAYLLYFRGKSGFDAYFKTNLYLAPFFYLGWFYLYIFKLNPHLYLQYY